MTATTQAFELSKKTPLPMAVKGKFMNHVNEEHQDELVMFIEAFTEARVGDNDTVLVQEVFADGLLISADDDNLPHFIAFKDPIDESTTIKSQYIYLLQSAAKKLGKLSIKLQQRRFTVIDRYFASANMLRLKVRAPKDTPLNHAGFAYLFNMLSEEGDSPKLQRYYTLRKAWYEKDSEGEQTLAWIDVFLHGDTAGGNWAQAMGAGDVLTSVRDYPEKITHLAQGQCLLICDETSMPTVANLLEQWQNPIAPMVILTTNDPKDLSYLTDCTLSKTLANHEGFFNSIQHITKTSKTDIQQEILSIIQANPIQIEKVWGALDAKAAKGLRQELKATLQLPRQDLIMKVYWRG